MNRFGPGQRPRLERRAGFPLERLHRAQRRWQAGAGSRVAREFLTRRVAGPNGEWGIGKAARVEGGQLGLVAPRRNRHAPPGPLGIRKVRGPVPVRAG